jgi:hypothetical protein
MQKRIKYKKIRFRNVKKYKKENREKKTIKK